MGFLGGHHLHKDCNATELPQTCGIKAPEAYKSEFGRITQANVTMDRRKAGQTKGFGNTTFAPPGKVQRVVSALEHLWRTRPRFKRVWH